MQHDISHRLAEIETREKVRIFYACESGSRAWGFASQDSDYDVRFLYVRPVAWYLTIDAARDVIERPIVDNIDLAGWDLKKALRLFRKSNPPLIEWLHSPIVYLEKFSVTQQWRALLPEFYRPVSCLYHYLHMAERNFRQHLQEETVWVKKYFYVLRPILACRWIQAGYGPVPTEFAKLVERVVESKPLRAAIDGLLILKTRGNELSWGPRQPVISEFIEHELERLKHEDFGKQNQRPDTEKLNRLFRSALHEVWSGEGIP